MKWAAVSALLLGSGGWRRHIFWGDNGSSSTGHDPSIFLSDDNVAAVDQFLSSQPIKAVKIDTPVSAGDVSAIYGKYNINFTFLTTNPPMPR